MSRLILVSSVGFMILALLSLACLLCGDAFSSLATTPLHQRSGALALIFVGLSYGVLRASREREPGELVKGVLLGLAFVLWGGEQFLPAGKLVTAVDTLVIAIFVVDLSLIIHQASKKRA